MLLQVLDLKTGVVKFYDNPTGYVKDGVLYVDSLFECAELDAAIAEQGLQHEYAGGICDEFGNIAERSTYARNGEEQGEWQQPTVTNSPQTTQEFLPAAETEMVDEPQRCRNARIFQLMPEVDAILKFAPYDPLLEVQGGIDPEQYQQVFDGNLATEDLDEIWNILNSDLKPQGYTGHSLSISDLIEIYDGEQSRFHYVDRFGFVEPQLAFENTQTISL